MTQSKTTTRKKMFAVFDSGGHLAMDRGRAYVTDTEDRARVMAIPSTDTVRPVLVTYPTPKPKKVRK